MAKYKILYKLSHVNGALVDESWDEPLEFELGDGQLDSCLESCIIDAQVGQLQAFLLSTSEAFGNETEEAFQIMKRSDFPQTIAIELDAVVEFKTPIGDSYVGCIDKIKGDDITVNFNHPLAGSDVSFQVKILQKQ
ncbi:FKBP-type peptidyl-prolyl cis-trans isomerase SlpA [Isorropodon fossajaponicum endosymbiont JTNG4]|uniref:FKBP-type peptidyl-prolyl cis-trans isomerase n=1 Tax=Isorropodon fossajaponicum symbiont TaxID=883811 RepID=UPI0019155CAC|nr:FKBP-type peptidyl-prolyl cis-trans isomerase [Isorropodon fossajaponicum symbiont]BBB24375.1 FKBP-type peptidyl-prolyl cis-trans isomerase SlpA [Isorropodon fossajaponicum endosymbiont JTNG4]